MHIENACVITFDDGWADNVRHALPILRRYNVPATIFLSTGFMGSYEWPWPDRVSYYTAYAPETGFTEMLRYLGQETGVSLQSGDMTGFRRSAAAEMCIARMKREPHARLTEIMGYLDVLFSRQHEDLNTRRPWMTWDEVGEADQPGISFGAHTHNHVILTSCNLERAEKEIVTSRDVLSERIGRPVRMFSFPNGDYHEQHVDVLKHHGFTHAVTTKSGMIRASEDLLTLRRFMLHDDMTKTIPMLACRLAGSIPYF
jgi:peptidoglycan/xylan/chitin deacetylase (PgdA/CDA1 family)